MNQNSLTSTNYSRFGGNWTQEKLKVLEIYLNAYTKALKNTNFKKFYIDGFAGCGQIYTTRSSNLLSQSSSWLEEFEDFNEDQKGFLQGSTNVALGTIPPFDRYIFVEKRADYCKGLESLKDQYSSMRNRIDIRHGDANEQIIELCEYVDWRTHRAVLFLDPYGAQVEWDTIKTVANTKAIDMWVLFPHGIAVNRLLKKSGDIPESWKKRIDKILGFTDWYEIFYQKVVEKSIFGQCEKVVKTATVEVIGQCFNDRLNQVFAGVAENPAELRSHSKCPLYLLCFAVSNENGKEIALRIAENALKGFNLWQKDQISNGPRLPGIQ